MKLTNIIQIIITLALSFTIIGCDGDDSNGGGSLNAPATINGTTISFNPEVEFNIDGTTFKYTNDESPSDFALGSINGGTYTYTETGSTAKIELTKVGSDIGNPGDSLTINLSNFVGSASAITGFTVTVDGNSYSDGTVVSGTLVPKPSATTGTGGGGLPDNANVRPATINPAFVGTHTFTFLGAFGETPPASSPYQAGDIVTFEITADGKLIFEGRTLDAPFFLGENEFEVIWYDGTYGYAASGSEVLNEINVGEGYDYYTTGAFTFLGQFSNK